MEQWQLILFVLLVFPVFFVGLWTSICLVLSFAGGWRSLAENYPSDPTGQSLGPGLDVTELRGRSARLGGVNYNHALNFAPGPTSLGLSVGRLFRVGHQPVSIPWTEITARERRGFFVTTVELHFARVPRAVMKLRKTVAEELAAVSGGHLVIENGEP